MPEDHAVIQRDCNRLEKCADRKLIKLNKGKCKVLPLGRNNPLQQCMLVDDWLENSTTEKDTEGVADSKLKKSQHCAHVAKHARGMVGYVRSLDSRSREAILPLSSALVRHCWSTVFKFRAPHCKRDMELLDRVQQRTMQMMKGLEHLP